jgi:hypothetical protein
MELLLKLVHQQRFIGRTVVNGLSTTVPCRSAADNVFLTDKKSDALFPNFVMRKIVVLCNREI